MLNRDSVMLWVGAIGALVLYLQNADGTPIQWDYNQWLQFVAFVVAFISGKLATSPLKGADEDQRVSGGPRLWFLPLMLAASIGVSGCLPKVVVTPQPPVEDVQAVRAKAIEIAKVVESAGNLIVEARRVTGVAYDTALITTAQRNAVYQAIIDLEPKAHALIDIAATVTTTPQLQSTVKAFVAIIDDLLEKLSQGNGAMSATANAIRTALEVVFAFVGGDR